MVVSQDRLKNDLKFFLSIVGVLTLIGLIFIYSASSIFALEKFKSSFYFLKKQLIFLFPALFGFVVFATVPVGFWKKTAPLFFLFSLIITTLTFLPQFGLKIHGSARWISIFGFGFQPSEMLKLFLFIYIGFFLEKKQRKIRSFVHSYLPFLTILGLTFVVLLKQPDFGSVVTILITSMILFFVAEFKMTHLLFTILFAIPAVAYLILTKAYRLHRILIFLNPWSDPQGRGFQIIQSLIAIGTGDLWGLGISNSKQKFFYLPMQHTDFIFPIIAEETGFVGSCMIVILFFLFCFFGIRIALRLEKPFAFFTTLGFVVLISLQAVTNLMVTSGLLPTKGLGLPFISYGGTSLVCLFCMIGLIANFVRRQKL
jgi:cell division protein FtsW